MNPVMPGWLLYTSQITDAAVRRYSTVKSFLKFRKISRNTAVVEYYIGKANVASFV